MWRLLVLSNSTLCFVVMLLIYCAPVLTNDKSPDARLFVQMVRYSNPSNHLSDGRKCNIFGNTCDPYFVICVSPETRPDMCLFVNYKSSPYYGAQTITANEWADLGSPIVVDLQAPVPKTLLVAVSVLEYDALGVFQKAPAAEFLAAVEMQPHPNNSRPSPRNAVVNPTRRDQPAQNDDVTLQMRMFISCATNRFGQFCEKYCTPIPGKFTCNDNGDRVCEIEWIGEMCDLPNPCYKKQCPKGSTCMVTKNNHDSLCVCDVNKGSSCHTFSDPCVDLPCQNGGQCQALFIIQTLPQPTLEYQCLCNESFRGRNCELRNYFNQSNTASQTDALAIFDKMHYGGHLQGRSYLSAVNSVILWTVVTVLLVGGLTLLLYCCFGRSCTAAWKHHYRWDSHDGTDLSTLDGYQIPRLVVSTVSSISTVTVQDHYVSMVPNQQDRSPSRSGGCTDYSECHAYYEDLRSSPTVAPRDAAAGPHAYSVAFSLDVEDLKKSDKSPPPLPARHF